MTKKDSHISWTEKTWNPTTGCTKVSAECKNCYAEVQAKEFQQQGLPAYKDGFKPTFHSKRLNQPKYEKTPTVYFVNSMSDLFHNDFTDDQILSVFEVMNACHQHIFQVLTKRPERLLSLDSKINWTENIWMGVSAGEQKALPRIDVLRQTGAITKFLSVEPLLEDLPSMNLANIDWVIVGGESGQNARPMDATWAEEVRQHCLNQHVPFFFKQMGGTDSAKGGDLLNGQLYHEMPKSFNPSRYSLSNQGQFFNMNLQSNPLKTDGVYDVKITQSMDRTNQNNKPYRSLCFKVLTGSEKGKTFWDNFYLTPQALWKLGELVSHSSKANELSTTPSEKIDMVGATLTFHVKLETNQSGGKTFQNTKISYVFGASHVS